MGSELVRYLRRVPPRWKLFGGFGLILAVITLSQRHVARWNASQILTRQLTRERDTLRATLESSPDAVAIVDSELRPLLYNGRYGEWFGVRVSELAILPPEVATRRSIARVADAEDFYHWTSTFRHDSDRTERRRVRFTSGPVTEVDCYTAPIRAASGGTIGRVFTYHDVSRETALARGKNELVSMVGHELRTPLATVVGFAELLLVKDYAKAERQQFLRMMLDEGRRLTSLINDFLELQWIDSDRQEIRPISADPRPSIEETALAVDPDSRDPVILDTLPSAIDPSNQG